MGYIGRDNTLSTFTKQSITADGGTSFTLNQGVGDSSSILVSIGGIVQQPDVAYSASGTTLTFTSAPTNAYPIWVIYLGKELTVTNETATDNVDSQAGVGNGTTTPVTLVNSVSSAQSIIVTLNGIAQVPGTDFTVSGTTLTFTTAPSAAMNILVYYVALSGTVNVPVDYSVSSASQFVASGTWPAWNGSALTGAGGDATQADIDGLIAALATLSFLQNVDHSTALLNFVNGWDDTFTVATSVDGEDFSVPMTKFSSTSAANNGDRLSIADGSLGQTDVGTPGLEGTVSFWWDATGTNDTDYICIFDTTNTGVRIVRNPTGDATFPGGFGLFARFGSPNATKINCVSADSVGNYAAKGLIHVVCSWKIGGVEADRRFHWVIDGELIANHAPSLILAATAPDWTTGNFFIGSNGTGSTGVQGSLGQFYFIQDYIDLSVQANREKFVSGTGASVKPVDFGADGSTPLGAQPLVYLNNPYSTFQNNAGSGGNFTVMAHTGTAELVDGGYIDTSDTNALYSSDSFTNSYELLESFDKKYGTANATIHGGTTSKWGNAITFSSDLNLTKVALHGKKTGSPTGDIFAFITTVTGTPGTNGNGTDKVLAVSNSVNIATLSSSINELVVFEFPKPFYMPAGNYWIGIEYQGGDGSNFLALRYTTSTLWTSIPVSYSSWNAGAWNNSTLGVPMYIWGTKNVNLITKGTDALTAVDSPASAPTKGHLEALVDDRIINTAIQDSSSSPHTIAYATAKLSTTQKKFGTHSIKFDGTDEYVSVANSSDWAFSGDFTAECWFYNTLSNSNDHLMGPTNHTSGAGWGVYFNGTGVIKYNDYSNSFVLNGGDANTGWTANTWNHVAVVRSGSTIKLYLNGTEKYSGSNNSTLTNSGNFGIGSDNGITSSMHHNGYIDEVRLSNVARYTSAFTPSATEFTSDANTKLLIHGDEVVTYPTLNTHIIGELSRDGGTTWSPATLARSSTGIDGATSKILSGDVDFTGDPSGTNVVGRIRTVNKHKVTVDGISVNWS